jgi:hypothetical protein
MHKTNNRVRRMLFINLANVVYQFYVCRAGRHLSDGQQLTIALPTFHSGGTLVDIADRNALYQATEGR